MGLLSGQLVLHCPMLLKVPVSRLVSMAHQRVPGDKPSIAAVEQKWYSFPS